MIEERGRLPLCCIVAAGAVRRRIVYGELATMNIIVTCRTFRGSGLEIDAQHSCLGILRAVALAAGE